MSGQRRLFIWVQHLLGIGHLMRAAHIARHMAAQGWSVTLASGGAPVPLAGLGGVRFVQLPPLTSADVGFLTLVDSAGRAPDDEFRAARCRQLLAEFRGAEPDILLIEHFPFGRSQLRFELDALLAAAQRRAPRPAIVASVRDILVRRKPAREAETAALVARLFDAVLVHGDRDLVPLDASFGPAGGIADKLIYTGYVGAVQTVPEPPGDDGKDEIVVSAGGGAVGDALIAAAFGAAPTSLPARRWRVLLGANVDAPTARRLTAGAPVGVIVERARPDFRGLLRRAALSVSQAGYNTVVDVLAAGVPAVLVPFAAGSETEQSLRASRLAERGLARVVAETALTPETLAEAAAASMAAPRRKAAIALDGEAATFAALDRLYQRRKRRRAS